jgi:hypothetical protein
MADTDTQKLTLLAKLVIAIGIALLVVGAVSHPVTVAAAERIWHQELARASAPMKFRFVLQPLMAALVAIGDGRKDARAGRLPYIWALLGEPHERRARLNRGLNATARIIVLGLVMDVIYQLIFLKTFYPVEALIISLALAFLPYVLIRGPVARIARRWGGAAQHEIS